MRLCLLPLLLLSSCSWRYAATLEAGPQEEKIVFTLTGYDLLYGPGQGKGETWEVNYPSSALDSSTETVNARDFTKVAVDSKDVTNSVSGYLARRGDSKIEARLVRTLRRPDGSSYSSEAPFNGVHRLKRENR